MVPRFCFTWASWEEQLGQKEKEQIQGRSKDLEEYCDKQNDVC